MNIIYIGAHCYSYCYKNYERKLAQLTDCFNTFKYVYVIQYSASTAMVMYDLNQTPTNEDLAIHYVEALDIVQKTSNRRRGSKLIREGGELMMILMLY